MKTITLTLLCLILTPIIVNAQWLPPSTGARHVFTIDSLIVKNGIKIKTEFESDEEGNKQDTVGLWEYDQSGKLIRYDGYLSGRLSNSMSFRYNEHDLADTIFTRFDDGIGGDAYVFDENAQLLEYYNRYNHKSSWRLTEKYTYSNLQLETKLVFLNYSPSTKHSYKYDDVGNIIEELIQSAKTSSFSGLKTVNEFDKHNWLISSNTFSLDDGAKQRGFIYQYDQNGNLISHSLVIGQNRTQYTIKYFYGKEDTTPGKQLLTGKEIIGRGLKNEYFKYEYQKH